MTKMISLATTLLALMAGAASAHPGDHAFTIAASFWHLLTEPDHLAIAGGVLAAIAAMIVYRRRSRAS